jgi:hypothetical protein
MKTVHRFGAQGDVVFIQRKAVPKGAKPIEYGKALVVAHSETGHHHIIDRPDATMALFADATDPLISYLQLRGRAIADVVHLRDFDTHETIRLDAGSPDSVWEVRRQREWTPERERAVND